MKKNTTAVLATEIFPSFQVTKGVFPIMCNLGKVRFREKLFFPNYRLSTQQRQDLWTQ